MEDLFAIFSCVVLPYLIGSIPFGLLLTKLAGLGDIRSIGSGNIGATNVLRTGNKKLAALTLLCDALKGFAPVAVAIWFITPERFCGLYPILPEDPGMPFFRHVCYGTDLLKLPLEPVASLLYVFGYGQIGAQEPPPYTLDALAAFYIVSLLVVLGHMFPVWLKFKGGKGVATSIGVIAALHPLTALITLALWIPLIHLTRLSSLSTLIVTAVVPISLALFGRAEFVPLSLVLIVLIFFKHRANIGRLLNCTEPKIGACCHAAPPPDKARKA